MDSDLSTPISRYFTDDSFVVRADENRYNEAILWVSFSPEEQSINMAVLDGATRAYTHEFRNWTVAGADEFFAQVKNDYGFTAPVKLQRKVKDYVTLLPQVIGLLDSYENDDESSFCEQCGDQDRNSIEAFYFPALSGKFDASIAAYWDFGHSTGRFEGGEFTISKESVEELVQSYIDSMEDMSDRYAAQAFLDGISAL